MRRNSSASLRNFKFYGWLQGPEPDNPVGLIGSWRNLDHEFTAWGPGLNVKVLVSGAQFDVFDL